MVVNRQKVIPLFSASEGADPTRTAVTSYDNVDSRVIGFQKTIARPPYSIVFNRSALPTSVAILAKVFWVPPPPLSATLVFCFCVCLFCSCLMLRGPNPHPRSWAAGVTVPVGDFVDRCDLFGTCRALRRNLDRRAASYAHWARIWDRGIPRIALVCRFL